MVKIYCLLDPFSGLPFYVGATRNKLEFRLNSHVAGRKVIQYVPGKTTDRHNLIKSIVERGEMPLISCLLVVPTSLTDIFEHYCYLFLTSQGIDLLQSNCRFTYQGHYDKRKTLK